MGTQLCGVEQGVPFPSVGISLFVLERSCLCASQGPSAMWRSTSVRPARVERAAPVWMGKMDSVASVRPAPCLLSACLRIILVPTSPAATESAMTPLAGEALPQLLTPLLLSLVACHP